MDQGSTPISVPSNPVQPADQQQVAQPVQAQPATTQVITTPVEPVSSPVKEHLTLSQPLITEAVQPAEPEPVLAPELKEAGVVVMPNPEEIKVQPELKTIGISPVKTAVPVKSAQDTIPNAPVDEKTALKIMKTHHPIDSIRWLATLVVEQAQKLNKKLFT